jgi:hypothetical protein
METLLRGRPVRGFVEPAGMVRVEVCADSGLRPVAFGDQGLVIGNSGSRWPARCPHTVTEIFIEGTDPGRTDDWHWWVVLDERNGLLAGPGCSPQFTVQQQFTLYPAEAQDWIRWQSIPQPPDRTSPLCPGGQAAPAVAQSTDGSAPTSLVLTSPDQGSRFQLSPEIPPSAQHILVAARPADGLVLRQVTLLADGEPLVTLTSPPYQALWPLALGNHMFTAVGVDLEGSRVRSNPVTIDVID